MANTSIEWTDATWNPVTGCDKISPGCQHCYAEKMANRLKAMGQPNYANGFALTLQPHMLDHPLKWKQPKRIFVNSMSDLFHKDVPDSYIDKVVRVMAEAHWHTFQVLTKRADRMQDYCDKRWTQNSTNPRWLSLKNVWWGVSVEDKKYGLPRIEHLRKTPAAVRILSCEPLLEDLGEVDLTGIGWVIAGGESGPNARPMGVGWLNGIRDQCLAAGVPVFIKQMGSEYANRKGFTDSKGGDWTEWAAEHRIRQFPNAKTA